MNEPELRSYIASMLEGLADDELRVAAKIIQRLALGRKCYGVLDIASDSRDFREEMLEEILDAQVYCAIAMLAEKKPLAVSKGKP